MRGKLVIVVSLVTTILMIFSFSPLKAVNAASTKLRFYADVAEMGPGYAIGRTFKVALVIEDVYDLYGLDIQLNWTTEYVHYVEHILTIPFESFPVPIPPSPYGGILHAPRISVKNIVNETGGLPGADPQAMAWFADASMLPAQTFEGSGTVAVFTFNVTDQPFLPQNATFRINAVDSTLADSAGLPITHDTTVLEIPLYGRPAPNLKITGAQAYPKVVSYGGILHVDVNVTNDRESAVATNITIYANGTSVATQSVMLEGNNATMVIVNATVNLANGFDLANYSISVYVWPVPGESSTADNSFDCGAVTVKLIGDVDRDNDVDVVDVVLITSIYGSKRGQPQYNPRSDLNNDGMITILDIVTCVAHYGSKYP